MPLSAGNTSMAVSHIRSLDIHQEIIFPFDKLFLWMLSEVLVTPFAAYKHQVRVTCPGSSVILQKKKNPHCYPPATPSPSRCTGCCPLIQKDPSKANKNTRGVGAVTIILWLHWKKKLEKKKKKSTCGGELQNKVPGLIRSSCCEVRGDVWHKKKSFPLSLQVKHTPLEKKKGEGDLREFGPY